MYENWSNHSINKTKAVSDQVYSLDTIPLLDLEDPDFGTQLVENFRKIGFVIIGNHGISQDIIDKAFDRTREVFQLPIEVKKGFGTRLQSEKNRGYTAPGNQFLEGSLSNQKKQVFDLGHPQGPGQLKSYPKNDAFIEIAGILYTKLHDIYKRLMREMQKGLNLEEGFLTKKCCKNFYDQTFRFLYYPQITLEELQKTGKTRIGAHSDYGTVTLLLQKPGFGQNGLRALNSNKHWVKVNPPDYTIVLNLGDLFQHWTNDALISTIHKVEVDDQIYQKLKTGEIEKVPSRQTIVMFCDPDPEVMIECLPGFGEPKYEPINGKEYVKKRIQAAYVVPK